MRDKLKEQIDILENIYKNKELRSKLEALIKENNFKTSDINNSSAAHKSYDGIVSNLDAELRALSFEYNDFGNYHMRLYLSLDKTVIGKIPSHSKGFFDIFLSLFDEENSIFLLNGSTFQKAFNSMNSYAIDFIIQHKHLFPDSTQNFIKNKLKSPESKVKIKLKDIQNNFQAKLLSNTFPKIPDQPGLLRYMDFLKSRNRNIDKSTEALNYLFFYKALKIAYGPLLNDLKFKTLKTRLLTAIYTSFYDICTFHSIGMDSKIFYTVFNEIFNDDELFNYFIDKFAKKNTTNKVSHLFAKFAQTEYQKEKA